MPGLFQAAAIKIAAACCVSGMASMLGVKVPASPGEGNHEPKATASPRGGPERKPEDELGADEQKPDLSRSGTPPTADAACWRFGVVCLADIMTLTVHLISLSCPAKAGHPVIPAPSVKLCLCPNRGARGYWIARSSRATTAMVFKRWKQNTSLDAVKSLAMPSLADGIIFTGIHREGAKRTGGTANNFYHRGRAGSPRPQPFLTSG
jgi:hypothetical protein